MSFDMMQELLGNYTVSDAKPAPLLSIDDLDALVNSVKEASTNNPYYYFSLSTSDLKHMLHLARIAQLYAAHPLPMRKIRKCQMRKRYAALKQGRRRIARIERLEAQREAA